MKKLLDFIFSKSKEKATKKRLHRQFIQTQKWIAEM